MNSIGGGRTSLRQLIAAWAVMAAVIAPTAVLLAATVNRGLGPPTWLAAAIGGGVCWLAAVLALSATFFGNQLKAPVQGLLVGMLFRLALPLVAVVLASQILNEAARGVTTTILGVYLVALVAETLLALRMVPLRSPLSTSNSTSGTTSTSGTAI